MDNDIIQWLPNLATIVLAGSALVIILSYRRADKLHKLLCIYLLAMLFFDCLSQFLGNVYRNNLIVLPLFSISELILMSLMYQNHMLKKKYLVVRLMVPAALLYICAEIVYYFILNHINVLTYQPYAKVISNFVIIILSFIALLEATENFGKIDKKLFRLNLIFLIYFTLTLLFFLPFNFLVNASTIFKFYLLEGMLVCNIVFYLFLTYSIWKNGRIHKL